MADPNAANDWLDLIKSFLPYAGGGGITVTLYLYFRKIDADNKALDRARIADQRGEIQDKQAEITALKAEIVAADERNDQLQAKLNEAYKLLYPNRGVDND